MTVPHDITSLASSRSCPRKGLLASFRSFRRRAPMAARHSAWGLRWAHKARFRIVEKGDAKDAKTPRQRQPLVKAQARSK